MERTSERPSPPRGMAQPAASTAARIGLRPPSGAASDPVQPVAPSEGDIEPTAAAVPDASGGAAAETSGRVLAGTAEGDSEATAGWRAELPRGTTVLHVGDSFAAALGQELNTIFEGQGIRGVLHHETATYIPTWASKRELGDDLVRFVPDLVLITLGANELDIPNPQARAEPIRRLVGRLEGRPCVWIGVPLWEGASPDLLDVIRRNVAPCLYLDSVSLVPNLERARDRIHPTKRGRQRWATAVAEWLRTQLHPARPGWTWRHAQPQQSAAPEG